MKTHAISAILCFFAATFGSCGSGNRPTADYDVIPLPGEITLTGETDFIMHPGTRICYPENNARLEKTAGLLAEYIRFSTGLNLRVVGGEAKRNAIILTSSGGGGEAYRISVSRNRVTIEGDGDAGVFYGVQTLRKSLPVTEDRFRMVHLPAVRIADQPRFGYRGALLDVGRHFFPVEFVKEFIDILALHNINTFHWHLTEDQGWRIEIKKYPLLTEVGSVRRETVVGTPGPEPNVYDGTPYGGFYTQDEIRDIVAYAQDRHVNIIPEIDMPGHTLSALASYPHLGCTEGPYEVAVKWGIKNDILCPGRESTFEFVEGVLDEVMELFPSKYIHIGGDEAPKTRWESCRDCRKRMAELGLKSGNGHSAEEKLQSYFISRVENYLNSKGRSIIGWDEILEGGLAPNATVMSWRGIEGGIAAAKAGHDAIMVPSQYLYLDYYQADKESEPLAIGSTVVPISKLYSYEPMAADWTQQEREHIIGVQGNLWTEYISTPEHAEYMFIPRIGAVSEIQWSAPEKKDYNDFVRRADKMRKLYDKKGYNYARHIFGD